MERTELINTITEHPDWTLQQLGDSFGVTRQAVYSMLRNAEARGIDHGYTCKKTGKQNQVQPCGARHPAQGFCKGCSWSWLTKEQKFWARVNFEGECWLWEGAAHPVGYGWLSENRYAHQEAYKYTYGPIPDGLYILHACDVKLCVNPTHLRAGTQAENVNGNSARGLKPRKHGTNWIPLTHCRRGHEFTEENTYHYTCANGKKARQCKTCNCARTLRRYYSNLEANRALQRARYHARKAGRLAVPKEKIDPASHFLSLQHGPERKTT